jgi:hypothetical protein
MKNAWSICLQAFFYSDFIAKLLLDFGANYYTKSNVNSYFVLQNRTPYFYGCLPFLMIGLWPLGKAIRFVQLRRLETRGHKPKTPKRQRSPFRGFRLMLVVSKRAASAFLLSSSRA